MNNKSIITLVVGLVLGIGGTIGVISLTDNDTESSGSITQKTSTDHSAMTMDEINKELAGKTGDEFDKAFLEMMTVHHQGATEMADLASTRAKHKEIKSLSQEIIKAQNIEIAEMQQWQQDWGYATTKPTDMMHESH